MRRLDRYTLRELIPPLLFGLLLYSGLAVVSATLARLQWIVGAPVLPLLRWLVLQLPTAVVQTLPIALVLAVLLAFGQLASGRELLAMRAGGVSVGRAALPAVLLGAAATVGALLLNQYVLPATQAQVGSSYWELTSGRSGLFRLVGRGVPVGDFRLTFQRIDGDELGDVRVERWDGETLTLVTAERAAFEGTRLLLWDYALRRFDFGALRGAAPTLPDVLLLDAAASGEGSPLELATGVTSDDLVARFGEGGFEDPRSVTELWRDGTDPAAGEADRRRALVLFQRRLAEPFANLALLLVALPLSVLYSRSRAVAFGLSLVVTLAWYLLLTFGQLFAQTGVLPIWLGPWLGNLVLAAAGLAALLLRRQASAGAPRRFG